MANSTSGISTRPRPCWCSNSETIDQPIRRRSDSVSRVCGESSPQTLNFCPWRRSMERPLRAPMTRDLDVDPESRFETLFRNQFAADGKDRRHVGRGRQRRGEGGVRDGAGNEGDSQRNLDHRRDRPPDQHARPQCRHRGGAGRRARQGVRGGGGRGEKARRAQPEGGGGDLEIFPRPGWRWRSAPGISWPR